MVAQGICKCACTLAVFVPCAAWLERDGKMQIWPWGNRPYGNGIGEFRSAVVGLLWRKGFLQWIRELRRSRVPTRTIVACCIAAALSRLLRHSRLRARLAEGLDERGRQRVKRC